MTASTEQERAEFEDSVKKLFEQFVERDFKRNCDNYKYEGTQMLWELWKSARRAAAVPQGWRILPEVPTSAMESAGGDAINDPDLSTSLCECAAVTWAAMLAAAPQPPEAGCSVSNAETEAAPGQLPVLESRIDVLEVAKELKESVSAFGDTKGKAKEKAAFYLASQYEQILYWQEQVHQLLAAPPLACNPSMQPLIESREVFSTGSGLTVTRCNLSEQGRAALQSKTDHFPAVGQMVAQRIYTYKHQPTDNVVAWRLGEACSSAKPGGDYIDRGLSLLQQLEKKGYGIAELKK